MTPEFIPFPKMARLAREVIVTEKIDGTNSTVAIIEADGHPVPCAIADWTAEDGRNLVMLAGSRTQWITPQKDNHGFARWVVEHAEELKGLGEGTHRGEWWGQGIQRNYGLKEKRWSLFNTMRWCRHDEEPQISTMSWDDKTRTMVPRYQERAPACCHMVPVLWRGIFDTAMIEGQLTLLRASGSVAAPGFAKPEGLVVFHIAGNVGFKKTLDGDDEPKSKST